MHIVHKISKIHQNSPLQKKKFEGQTFAERVMVALSTGQQNYQIYQFQI